MSSLSLRACVIAFVLGTLSLVTGVVPALGPTAAAQADTYRFWSYWQAEGGAWTLATKGPASTQPADGTVEGWRFTKSTGGAGKSAEPRPEPAFNQICADTPDQQGMKRVGVVIDYGTAKDAALGGVPPVSRAACAQVAPDATGQEVLAAVAEEQFADSGLVCAVDGYPEGACGGAASDGGSEGATAETASPSDENASPGATGDQGAGAVGDQATSSGLPVGAIVGVAVGGLLVGVLGGAAVLRARRSG